MAKSGALKTDVQAALFGLAVLSCSAGAAPAADLTTGQVSQTAGENALPPNSDFPKWYVKLGLLGVLNQSSSNLYAQTLGDIAVTGIGFVPIGVGPQEKLPGRGATYSNLVTVGVQAGYFFAQNWSLSYRLVFPFG
jgi:hypothetical protein